MLSSRKEFWLALILALSSFVNAGIASPIAFGQSQKASPPVTEKRYTPELVIQTGHTSLVNSVAFLLDGKTVASAGGDNSVKLWDIESGRQIKSLAGHTRYILSVAVSSKGTLASGGLDNTVKLWNVETGEQFKSLAGHSSVIYSVAFSPDAKTVASASGDHTVKLWNVETGQQLKSLEGHTDQVFSVTFSPDGKTIASGSIDNTIKLWNVETGQQLKSFEGHTDEILSVAFSLDGKILASAGKDNVIKLWNVDTGGQIKSLEGHTALIYSVAFSPDGKTLASAGADNIIKLWNVETGEQFKSLAGHTSYIRSIEFSKDGKTLLSCSSDNTIKLWNVETGRQIKSLISHTTHVIAIAVSSEGKTVASASFHNIIKLWNIETGEQGKSLEYGSKIDNTINTVTFSPDGKTLASGGKDNKIKLWAVETGQLLKLFEGHASWVYSVAFSPDGKTLVSGSEDNTVKLWNVETGQQIKSLEGHAKGVKAVAFAPNGETVASGSKDSIVKLWDIRTGRQSKSLAGHTGEVSSVAFSPDGTTLTSGSFDKTVRLWNVETGQPKSLAGHTDKVNSVSFSPDGKTLASGSDDRIIKLWDVASGHHKTLEGHVKEISSVAFSPDNNLLLSGSWDATTKLWRTDNDKAAATLISLDRDDWVVVTPDGRFDASTGAEELMHYVLNTPERGYEVIAFDQLKLRYYEPDLLKRLFKGAPLRDVKAFRDVRLTPDVQEVAASSRNPSNTKRTIKLTNRGGGIGRVQVFVNGREFIEDARDEKLKANPNLKEYVLSFDLKEAAVIPGQKPVIKVVVWNYDEESKEGYISSRGTDIDYLPEEKIEPPPSTLYAIIGGVSDYKGDSLDLNYAAKDAEDIYKAIQVGGRNLFGVERLKLKLLSTSENKDAVLPTKENFRQAFAEFAREAKANDVLVVYLAGHGITINFGNSTYYYLTQDAITNDKEMLSRDNALLSSSTINSEELTQWHKGIKAQNQVLILDTCAAGAIGEKFKIAEKRELSPDAKRAIDNMSERVNFYVLMGSADNAVSYEASQYGQGLLTYSLLQGIKGAALPSSGEIDVSALCKYAVETVPVLAKNIGGIQRPEVEVPKGGTSFALGFIKTDDDKKQIPLAQVKPVILRPSFQNQVGFKDNLRIGSLLKDRFREAHYALVRGHAKAGLVFVDIDEMPDAILPIGRYIIEDDLVKVTLILYRNDEQVSTLKLEGNKNDLSALAEKIFVAVNVEAQKLNATQSSVSFLSPKQWVFRFPHLPTLNFEHGQSGVYCFGIWEEAEASL